MRRDILGKVATLAVAGVVAVGAAGCGSSSKSSGTSASSGGGSHGSMLVGVIAGTTGAYGSTGVAVVNGAKLAAEEINAKGGVSGKQITIQSYNDNASSTLASQLFQRLASSGAVAVDGSPDTGPATVAMAQRLKLPDIGVVDDAGITIYPNGPTKPPYEWAWSWGLNTFAWGGIDAQYALQNCKGLALLHDPQSYGEGGDAAIKLAYEKAGKKLALDEAITENWSSGATVGLTSELSKIKQSGADCVVVWLTPQDIAAFVQQMSTQGDKFTVIGNDEVNADETFSSLAGAQANGTIGASLKEWLNPSPALKEFMAKYKEKFNVEATEFASASYDSIFALKKAIETGGSTEPEAIRKALDEIKGLEGLNGTMTLSPQEHATIGVEQLGLVKYSSAAKAWQPISGSGK